MSFYVFITPDRLLIKLTRKSNPRFVGRFQEKCRLEIKKIKMKYFSKFNYLFSNSCLQPCIKQAYCRTFFLLLTSISKHPPKVEQRERKKNFGLIKSSIKRSLHGEFRQSRKHFPEFTQSTLTFRHPRFGSCDETELLGATSTRL